MDKAITYVGLDVHKDTIAVALAEAGAHKDVREYGKVANTATALVGWSKTLAREVARDGVTVNIVAPGRIATARVRSLDEARAAREGRTVEEVAGASAADIPVGRYG